MLRRVMMDLQIGGLWSDDSQFRTFVGLSTGVSDTYFVEFEMEVGNEMY